MLLGAGAGAAEVVVVALSVGAETTTDEDDDDRDEDFAGQEGGGKLTARDKGKSVGPFSAGAVSCFLVVLEEGRREALARASAGTLVERTSAGAVIETADVAATDGTTECDALAFAMTIGVAEIEGALGGGAGNGMISATEEDCWQGGGTGAAVA